MNPAPTVWQALDTWATKLKSWQRAVLAHAIKSRVLSEEQVEEVYRRFLHDEKLQETEAPAEIAVDVTGRPAEALTTQLRLEQIDEIDGVNALPKGAILTFGPALTIIYGRNGAGKSGFARLIANACFSRHKPSILGNIYEDRNSISPTAKLHIAIDGARQKPILFSADLEHADLRRISFFDTAVARQHVSGTAPFEFKPAGFDIFPEMARVYGLLASRLEADIVKRTRNTKFSDSFIGDETEVSKAASSISASTDLSPIRTLAVYGPTEKARLEEVDRQLTALKSSSQKDILAALRQARSDIGLLATKLPEAQEAFSSAKAAARTALSDEAKKAAEATAAMGSEQFKRSFFTAVGTPEWQAFGKSAHALARRESAEYPAETDRCLLCERPFDEESRTHVTALLAFVEGDAQRAAEKAAVTIQTEITTLQNIDLNFFAEGSRVREHVRRLDPTTEVALEDLVTSATDVRESTLGALRARTSCTGAIDTSSAEHAVAELLKRIDADIMRLQTEDHSKAIAALQLEHQTLRHREVLTQLFPSIEMYVSDAKWCAKAERAKGALNPRTITDKEKELSGQIISVSYRARLSNECEALDCILPIELQTVGQKGKTIRSLSMKGGYQPEIILSEGEQKAVALADFLTEVGLNPINAGIVLDDPVTSQDHERKALIAKRLAAEAKQRQVIVFTHDLPFLNQIISYAEADDTDLQTHWIDRDIDGRPGNVTLDDVPATSKAYDTVDRARICLAEARKCTGTARHDAICRGMGALRRSIEEAVVKKLFKGIVPRWSDRVIVTKLRTVAWDNGLADELVDKYEELSAYIEGHSHSDEAMGAPPECSDLQKQIDSVDVMIKRAKPERTA